MKRLLLLTICMLYLTAHLFAQAKSQGQARLDSLLSILPTLKQDSNEVNLLKEISSLSSSTSLEDAMKYAKLQLLHAQNIGWKKGQANAHGQLGFYLQGQSEYGKALESYFAALDLYEHIKDEAGTGKILCYIGTLYEDEREYQKALVFLNKSLAIAKRNNNMKLMPTVLFSIGQVYNKLNKFQLAISYFTESARLYEKTGRYENLPNSYLYTGVAYRALDLYSKGLPILTLALQKAKEFGQTNIEAQCLTAIGTLYYTAATDSSNRSDSVVRLGKVSNVMLAISYLNQALPIYREIGDRESIADASFYLSASYKILGRYDKALAAYQSFAEISDSIFNESNRETIKSLEDKRQIELRDKQIKITALELTNQKRQRNMYIGGLAMLAIIGGLFFRQSSTRRRTNTQLRALNAQLDTNNIKLTETNHQLDEANRVKARFFGILSHDLRAPIANLTGYLHLQREAPEMMNEQDRTKHQLTIENAANNLLSVMEDLLL